MNDTDEEYKTVCWSCNTPAEAPVAYRGEPVHGECRLRLIQAELAERARQDTAELVEIIRSKSAIDVLDFGDDWLEVRRSNDLLRGLVDDAGFRIEGEMSVLTDDDFHRSRLIVRRDGGSDR